MINFSFKSNKNSRYEGKGRRNTQKGKLVQNKQQNYQSIWTDHE
jgi:hypothetical protein